MYAQCMQTCVCSKCINNVWCTGNALTMYIQFMHISINNSCKQCMHNVCKRVHEMYQQCINNSCKQCTHNVCKRVHEMYEQCINNSCKQCTHNVCKRV